MKSRFVLLALCLMFALASYTPAIAAEKVADKPAAAAEEAIPAVPENGTLKDYQDCISALKDGLQKKIQSMAIQAQKDGVNPRSEEFANSLKMTAKEYFTLIEQAADKAMLLKDVSDKDFEELAGNKLQVIQLLAQINEEDESDVNSKLEAFAAQLRQLGKAPLADNIEGKLLQNKIIGYIRSGNLEAFSKIAAETDEKIEKAGKDITPPLAVQAMLIVLGAKDLEEYKAPEDRQAKYLKALSEASNPDVQKYAMQLERTILRAEGEKRFNDALGNEFKFGGTFTDGSEYKAEDYAGKVVLIDFWATWCGPCRAELPNVKKMFAAYHDKGFEVIGVTCDNPEEEEDLNKFLKDNDISWKQMFDEKAVVPNMETKDGKPVLVSEYYGINGIPCPVLIGKDGKVISLNARGKELKEQLVKIYGKVEGLDDADEEADDEPNVNDEEEDDVDDLDEDDQAADEAIPAFPENGKLADYKEYIEKLNNMLNKKAQKMIAQAQKDGVNPQSEEFANTLKNMANEYFPLIEKAIDKAFLLKDVSDDDFEKLIGGKIQVIQALSQINDEDVDAVNTKMKAFADQLRKMDKVQFADKIEAKLFQDKVIGYAMKGDVKAFAKAAAEIDEKVEKAGKDITPALGEQAILIIMIGNDLEGYEAPKGRLEKYTKALKESADPEVNELAKELEELLIRAEAEKRFKESLGKEFEFGGTFTDGSEYNAKDYAGKVVLIDFWATWCGPCCAELPNVKKMYAAFHDKGFEVIGVSCDDPEDEESFNKFLKNNDIPWKQMFDGKAVVPGQKSKDDKPVLVSEYYGINGIPCPILIGPDGKVISLNARGKELKEQLVKIYGEVEGLDDEADVDEDEFIDDEDPEDEDAEEAAAPSADDAE